MTNQTKPCESRGNELLCGIAYRFESLVDSSGVATEFPTTKSLLKELRSWNQIDTLE